MISGEMGSEGGFEEVGEDGSGEMGGESGFEIGGQIELHRDSDPRADEFVPYRIFVDGELRGQIRPGERQLLPVGPGGHRVSLACLRFWRSPTREVDVAPGATVRLRCR